MLLMRWSRTFVPMQAGQVPSRGALPMSWTGVRVTGKGVRISPKVDRDPNSEYCPSCGGGRTPLLKFGSRTRSPSLQPHGAAYADPGKPSQLLSGTC